MVMDIRSAELTKYAANAMLATKISFMNELSNIAEAVGADIEQVRIGIGSDPRIGYQFIYPGCGYGGSCFPKDVQALERTAVGVGYTPNCCTRWRRSTSPEGCPLPKISAHFDGDLAGKTIALWGLAFKPNTDDMREASSRRLMEQLWEAARRCAPSTRWPMERPTASTAIATTWCLRRPDGCPRRRRCAGHRHRVEQFRSPDYARFAAQTAPPRGLRRTQHPRPRPGVAAGLTYVSIGPSPIPEALIAPRSTTADRSDEKSPTAAKPADGVFAAA
jgi:UDPglucose 6-dehydrogenase